MKSEDEKAAEDLSRKELGIDPSAPLSEIDSILKTWLDYHYTGVLAGIAHQKAKERWIPVSERLPESEVDVLACYAAHAGLVMSTAQFDDMDGTWQRWSGKECLVIQFPVTHWKPIELPTKEGE